MRFSSRAATCVLCVVVPACVIKLSDRNAAEANGAVTGAPADCAVERPLPPGAPGGAAQAKYVGRFAFGEPAKPGEAPQGAVFDWSGNYISIRVERTSQVTAKLKLEGNIPEDQIFEFIVDNLEPGTRQITVQKNAAGLDTNIPLETYDIVGLDPAVPHEITIYKNTEAQKGSVEFEGFDLHGGNLLPPTRRARRIEFIGDSIMCGYGAAGGNATCPFEVKVRDARDANGNLVPDPQAPGKFAAVTVPLTEIQYYAFTAITARALDADAVTVCWSGKGVYLNYKERPVALDPDTKVTVPELWLSRTLGSDSSPERKWDFAKEKPEEVPQVVVISLGTNDLARDTQEDAGPYNLPGDNVPDGTLNDPAEFEKFFQKYLALVKSVRQFRPNAHIFVATPPMISDQFPIQDARRKLQSALLGIVAEMAKIGDYKVYKMDLVEQGFRYGLGCDYHPNLEVHRIMADQLIGAIRSKTCW
jgi:lysophospholipase L1-like esterase